MRIGTATTAAVLAAAFLTGATAPTAAGKEPPTEPTEAGTGFRTATAVERGVEAEAVGAVGDYLYWVFAAAAGEAPTATATVVLPDGATRSGNATWQLDVYDGLRRRQPCAAGTPRRVTRPGTDTVALSCTLRPVQPWAEQWANDPLPGAYFVRLTAVSLRDEDLGLPLRARIEVSADAADGARRGGGALPEPLLPAVQPGATAAPGDAEDGAPDDAGDADTGATAAPGDDTGSDGTDRAVTVAEPEDGWNGPWWNGRWLWTAAGGALAALAGVGGYLLAGRPRG